MGRSCAYLATGAHAGQKQALKEAAPTPKTSPNQRAYRNKPLSERGKEVDTIKSQICAKAEHPLLLLKPLWGFAKNAK